MPSAGTPAALFTAMNDTSRQRWEAMLDGLVGLLPAGSRRVLVDGPGDRVSIFAARLSERLAASGSPVLVTADAGAARDVAVFLRTAPGGRWPAARSSTWAVAPAGPWRRC